MFTVSTAMRSLTSRPGALAVLAGSLAAVTAHAGPPAAYQLHGVVRDFSSAHPDFTPGSADALRLSAGNLGATLDASGRPYYTGAGTLITTPARDAQGRPIAPAMVKAGPVTDFTISEGSVSSSRPMAAKVTVIGAAISAGGAYDCPVTMQVHDGGSIVAPFGSYGGALSGNVNDSRNPRFTVLPNMIQPGASISVDARSWTRRNATSPSTRDTDWQTLMTVNSASGGVQVKALRNGDSVPNVAGYLGQTSAKTFLNPFINATTRKISLAANQVIYLFELGSTSTSSAAFDMQDLVVLVDLATDPSYFESPAAPAAGCVTINDAAAVRGAGDLGGIASGDSFNTWFTPRAGYNVAKPLSISLVRGSDGVYAYSTPDFHPIDGDLYGNGALAHNRGFTYAVEATFSYCGCTGQFFEYTGDDEAWLYIDGKLVMDVGGVHVGARQYVDMDRLGLVDGATVKFQLFYAERSTTSAAFGVKTNILLNATPMYQDYTMGGFHD